jgi:hypothetical protein
MALKTAYYSQGSVELRLALSLGFKFGGLKVNLNF